MPAIELSGISNGVLRNVSLSVRDGECLVLAGATGAGKTTLLNVIAGLVDYRGTVCFGVTAVDGLPPAQRKVGYLFQSFALFPHMRVRDNIAFGLQARGADPARIRQRVDGLLQMLNIRHLETRYPKFLSGGEKQRVALARTLAPCPKILLLDEPFNSLDPRTADCLRLELKNLQRQLGLSAVYVTHDQQEAFEMGARIAVVDHGRIEQVGSPSEILFTPRTRAVSSLFGSATLLKCDYVEALNFGLGKAWCGSLSLIVPCEGKPVKKIAVMPSAVQISKYPIETPAPNRFKGIIREIFKKTPVVSVAIQIAETRLTAELPEHLWYETGLGITDSVHVEVPLAGIRILTDVGPVQK
jgi:ABC-type Fe3+/spermidine/putrescine transport system ATPase subunit